MTTVPSKKSIFLSDYTAPVWKIAQVQLQIDIHEEFTEVTAELDVQRVPGQPASCLRLHGVGLERLALLIDGKPVAEENLREEGEELLVLDVPEKPFILKSTVRIYPETNTALEGLYASGGMYCTQCEPEGFRKITYFPDRPDVMSRFTTTLIADRKRFPVLLSNGNPVDAGEVDDGRHFVTWDDPFPKPSYLFAAVAGDLVSLDDVFFTASGRKVDLRIYVEPHDLDKVDHAMSSLKRAMRWDEEVYGREYDLDIFMIVAVSHFNMGAMENKGLNIFNTSCVLANPATTTDAGFHRVESVVAHEYFHNWSGNRVTCRDWFQLSLKEGFTVFRDQQFSADMHSASVQRIEDVNMLRTWQFAEDAGPLAHPVRPESFVEINNFYTATVYEKGAEIVRMLHAVTGPEKFRDGSDLYFSRNDGMAVTVEDFVAALSQGSGIELSCFMQWYRQPGTPVLTATGSYDASTATYRLQLSQSVGRINGFPLPNPLPMPVRLALLGPDGCEMPVALDGNALTEHVVVLNEDSHEYCFTGVSSAPVVSLLRDFSAPVQLVQALSLDEQLFLLRHDGNGFNRWRIAQDVLSAEILRLANDEALTSHPECLAVFADMLPALADMDAALAARLMQLPTVGQLLEQARGSDPGRLHRARQALRAALTEALESWLLSLCQRPCEEAYVYSADAMAQRSLANTAMGLLVDYSATHAGIAVRRFQAARNMTDEAAALTSLVHAGLPEAGKCLEDFSRRWAHEPLVMDQWFMIQASAPVSGVVARIDQLIGHPDYDATRPNRVRAVLGQFANANPVGFHQADGSGYQLLCDQVARLDVTNPQLASRLLGALSIWPHLDDVRREAACRALRSIDQALISADLGETLGRLLLAQS
ncbi:MAG: aminopeptidase N [Moraxellaceae bacterium]|nr:aminopeptidase N [Moraxellaceae bacterium]